MANEPQTLAQGHPAEIWASLIGCVAIIMGLVTVLWNRLNTDIKAINESLAEGAKVFQSINETLVQLKEQITTLKRDDDASDSAKEKILAEVKVVSDRMLILETEHKRCIKVVDSITLRKNDIGDKNAHRKEDDENL